MSSSTADADLTALTWGNHVGNPSGVGISHKKSVLPDDHEFIALLLAFDNAVCHNARLRGIDSVTDDGVDAKDGEWVDEDTPHEAIVDYVTALLAALDEARKDALRLNALQRLIQICDRVEMFDTSLSGMTVILAADDVAGRGDFVREALDQCIADFRTSDDALRAATTPERAP
jgi:hypothetical protein